MLRKAGLLSVALGATVVAAGVAVSDALALNSSALPAPAPVVVSLPVSAPDTPGPVEASDTAAPPEATAGALGGVGLGLGSLPGAAGVAVPAATAPATAAPAAAPPPVAHPSWTPLQSQVSTIVTASGAAAGVAVIELGGNAPSTWSYQGDTSFTAASTYKMVALMAEAQDISGGTLKPTGQVCYEAEDYEDGWYNDYTDGACFTRTQLAQRAGLNSDNTAGHMLVRDVGGSIYLNLYASAHGARNSQLYDEPNTTTANDLAALLAAEARGDMGGAAAQAWLYPNLTNSSFEAGVPAGVPAGTTVVHKTGELDNVYNDAALVRGGRNGDYVVVVLSSDGDNAAGWGLLSQISAAVWQYEQARP